MRRVAVALVLGAMGLLPLPAPAHASECQQVGDVQTPCVADAACKVASRLGWACVE